MECGSYQIVQVFDNGDAEAWEMENYKGGYEIDSHMMPNCVSVILKAPENGSSYYDDQVIRLSSDQVSMRVGTMKMGKSTVPVVKIVER